MVDSSFEPASLLKAVEAAILSGLAAIDAAGRQSFVSPAVCERVSWAAPGLRGAKAPFVYWPPEEFDAIQAAFQTTVSGPP
jgi:hypothetical protein